MGQSPVQQMRATVNIELKAERFFVILGVALLCRMHVQSNDLAIFGSIQGPKRIETENIEIS